MPHPAACVRQADVPPGTVVLAGATALPCADCGAIVVVLASVRTLIERGAARPVCWGCAAVACSWHGEPTLAGDRVIRATE